MKNKNTIVFSQEDLLDKKRITGFLRNNNIEFTPKKNYYGDYEATIKVRNTASARKSEIQGLLVDKESRNKIESMFNLISGTSDSSKDQEVQDFEETPERNVFGILTSSAEKKIYNTEKNEDEIEEPQSAHFRQDESDRTMNLNKSLRGLTLDNGDELNLMVSIDKDNSGRISKNADLGYKIPLKEQSQVSTEPSTRVSEGPTQRSVQKSSSKAEFQSMGNQNSKSNLQYSSSKELKVEDEEESMRILAIANSLGKLQVVELGEEMPSVTPFQIVTDTNTTVKEQKEDMSMTSGYAVIDTPTLGQLACERESKTNLLAGVQENGNERRETTPNQDQSREKYNAEFYSSKKSSSSSIFTLCGEDAKKERSLMEVVGNVPPSSQRTDRDENFTERIEEMEEDEMADKFQHWQEMILKDDILRQVLGKIKENTNMDENEGIAILIAMLEQNVEQETERVNARIETAPCEMVLTESVKKESKDFNSTPTRKGKVTNSKQPSLRNSSSALKTSASLQKSESIKGSMTSEKKKKSTEPEAYVSSLQRKILHNESGHLNTSVASSKSLKVQANYQSNANLKAEAGRLPQSLSCQVFQTNLEHSTQEELIKKVLAMEEFDEPGNLSIDHDKFCGRGSHGSNGINDDISSIQYQDKSMENTRSIFETMDGRPSFGTAEDKIKENIEKGHVNSFGEVEHEYEENVSGMFEGNVLTEGEIHKNNSEIMKNINNLVSRSSHSSFVKNSASKASLKSEQTANKTNMSKILSHQNISRELASGKTSATSLLDEEKGRTERRRFTREKYNELSRKSFQSLLSNVEVKQENLKAKEIQAKVAGMCTGDMTKYFKTLVAKKKLENIEQSRKKPIGDHSLLLY